MVGAVRKSFEENLGKTQKDWALTKHQNSSLSSWPSSKSGSLDFDNTFSSVMFHVVSVTVVRAKWGLFTLPTGRKWSVSTGEMTQQLRPLAFFPRGPRLDSQNPQGSS